MADRSHFRLGKLPAKHNPKAAPFERYLMRAPLPAPQAAVDWLSKVKAFPLLRNDLLGDCAEAAVLHALQQWDTYAQPLNGPLDLNPPVDGEAIALYSAVTGYNPADPSTDKGTVLVDLLDYWMNTGVALDGNILDKLAAYTTVDPKNEVSVKTAISVFGNLYIGLQLPVAAQGQAVWDVGPGGSLTGNFAPGGWGGHCVLVGSYDADGLTCVTWGETLRMTWPFFEAYVDEANALLSHDFVDNLGTTPGGLNLDQLEADLQAVREI